LGDDTCRLGFVGLLLLTSGRLSGQRVFVALAGHTRERLGCATFAGISVRVVVEVLSESLQEED
jgi:hypothetical protein